MASNDQWPPVAPAGKNSAKNRSNMNMKKPTKEHQQQVMSGLTEMFQNTLEDEVILSVAHSCDWELQSCIDALIALSSTVEPQEKAEERGAFVLVSRSPGQQTEPYAEEQETDIFKMDKEELQKQKEEFKKFEKIKKTSSKNRMGSFRGNISKLDSNYKEKEQKSGNFDSIWNPPMPQSKADEKNWNDHSITADNAQFVLPQMPQSAHPWIEGLRQASTIPLSLNTSCQKNSSILSENQSQNKPKKESELCGLKVQYRTAGMESSSEDDDADVVIEEELTGSIPTSIPVNVSQLLSSSIQSPPQIACTYKAKTVTTSSPPRTPKRSLHQATVDRIKKSIRNGEKILILMRGLPGSGKSYLAKSLVTTTTGDNPSEYIFSTDDYFVALGRGIYMFDPRKLSDAHSMTQKKVYEAMDKGKTPVIIDNTNTQAWEMRPYAAMAVKHRYLVETLEPDTPWATRVNELAKKNSHGVPKDKIQQMADRFEHGITGEKLLAMFSLKYEPGTDPREQLMRKNVKNEHEELSVNLDHSSGNTPIITDHHEDFESSKNSEKKKTEADIKPGESTGNDGYQASPKDKHFLQIFGAIGSERKNSVVSTDVPIIPDSVNEEVNTDNDENIASHCSEMLEQDEEFGKKGKRNGDSPAEMPENEDDGVRSAVHNFLSELTQGFNNTSTFVPTPEQKQSSVIITELFEEQAIQNVTDIAASLLESTVLNDTTKQEISVEIEEHSVLIKKVSDPEKNCGLTANDNEKLIADEKEIENSSAEEKDLSFIEAENLSDIETAEEPKESQAQSTLGTIFNIIKISILGNTQDDESSQSTSTEIEQGKELKEFSLVEDQKLSTQVEKEENSESLFIDDVSKNPIAEIKAAIDSTDDVLMIECSDKHEDTEFYSLEIESTESVKMFSAEEVNAFVRALENSETALQDNVGDVPVDQPDSGESADNKEPEILDNINSITWKESPFPVDDLLLPKIDETINPDVPKLDASTNTTYYDFNVSYIGGTLEPMYKILPTFNRHINEGSLPCPTPERPPLKLMLDKSSMTGNIFSREGNSESEDTEEKKDGFPKLMELFPHIPRDYLMEIFERVKEDLDWAIEILLEGLSDDIPIKMPDRPIGQPEESSAVEKEENSSSSTPEVSESSSPDISIPLQSSVSADDLGDQDEPEQEEELEQGDEKDMEDIIQNEKMLDTPEIIKDSPVDVSDDAASTSTASVSRVESLEDEKSSESDELVELNLGFDCIRGLEQTLGIPNFHIPNNFSPVIQIKKSIAEELYANWIESLYQQANARHEQLDQMMAKDAELARSLERKMELEGASASDDSTEPNLEQIMDMELALAKYKNELKSIRSRETPDDLAARLSRQMLHEAIPDIDPDAFNEILEAHNGNFKEAFEIIEMNTGKVIVPCDTLKKQKSLMDEVKEEDRNLREKEPPIIVVRSGVKDDRVEYNNALAHARNSREKAQRQLSLKIQNYNKAAEAYRKGCPGVAAYYSQVARLHTKNIDAAHAAAASAFVEAQSWDDEDILDLHNLFVSEALTALEQFLEYHLDKLMRSNKRSSKIFIVTGRGARSNGGTSKIKPAVSQKLHSKNIRFSESNPGCLKVTLYRKNGTTD